MRSARRLKADERTRSIPIIFISILEDERDKVKGFQAGAVDYITKPFQPEEVLARVRTHLRLRILTDRLEQEVRERTEELATTQSTAPAGTGRAPEGRGTVAQERGRIPGTDPEYTSRCGRVRG